MMVRVAVVGTDRAARSRVSGILADAGAFVTATSSVEELLSSRVKNLADVVLVLPIAARSLEDARSFEALPDPPDLVVLSEDERADARRFGTSRSVTVLSAGLPDAELADALAAILRAASARGSLTGEPDPTAGESAVRSAAMLTLLQLADRVARGDSSVLVLGETGSGKEWLARRIHAQSRRADGPFVAVNCAAIPEGLAESELFGHVRGAFTGAIRSRRGHFEMAHGGTLFLDEVSELTPAVQVRLLRALQDRSFQPVGSERPVTVDLRVIAATNQPLAEAVADESFRKDLYYRLAVVTLELPPLRERRDDIECLVDHYLAYYSQQLDRPTPSVSEAAHRALLEYAWPGNIRELINVVERAVLLNATGAIGLEDLPLELAGVAVAHNGSNGHHRPSTGAVAHLSGQEWKEAAAEFEAGYLREVLDASEGRLNEAARRAGMSPRTLYNKMSRHGLRKEDFRE